jgi:enoyl-CoA hydratase/carnithine racemase
MVSLTLDIEGATAFLAVDRPEARNAVSLSLMRELDDAITQVEASDARVLVVRGNGDRVFISGGDIKEFAALRTTGEAREMALRMRTLLDRLASLPIPVIAALNGDALGGGAEVAVACDFRIAAEHARIGFVQARLGIMPAWGGIERLSSLVGSARAIYMLSTGVLLSAAAAQALGLIEEVVPSLDFEHRWRELAHEISTRPAAVLKGIKATVGMVSPYVFPESADLAVSAFAATWASEDHWEAARRWMERPEAVGQGGISDSNHVEDSAELSHRGPTADPGSPLGAARPQRVN